MARFDVNVGPSKFDLMLSVFHSDANARYLYFKQADQELKVLITGVERVDGSGEKYVVSGSAMVTEGVWKKFHGPYSTGSRTGRLTLED